MREASCELRRTTGPQGGFSLLLPAIVLGCLGNVFVGSFCVAQEPAAKVGKKNIAFVETDMCFNCHKGELKVKDFVSTSPGVQLKDRDKHHQSYALLEKNIERTNRILGSGIDIREVVKNGKLVKGNISDSLFDDVKTCLACHATLDTRGGVREMPTALSVTEGITCQACHGAGHEYYQPHQSKEWRLMTPEFKETLGMRDLRDPVVRAELCASCHVGNLSEGKFIRHEWYANGHPPLPSFEMSAFSQQMPVHWKPLNKKGEFPGRAKLGLDGNKAQLSTTTYEKANFAFVKDRDINDFIGHPRTKDVLVSGAVVMRTYVNLVRDYAEKAKADKEHYSWPEFALYDCTACHHELRRGTAADSRPQRRGMPGRPPGMTWPSALVELGMRHAAGYPDGEVSQVAEWRQLQSQWEDAFNARPFGNKDTLIKTGKQLDTLLAKQAKALVESPFSRSAAEKSRQLLTMDKPKERFQIRDYHTARQIAWAVSEITHDLRGEYASPPSPQPDTKEPPPLARYEPLFGSVPSDPLMLTLPSGQQDSVIGNLPSALKANAEFNVKLFQDDLKASRDAGIKQRPATKK